MLTHPYLMSALAYDKIGSGAPLVFLHGLGADRRQTTSALAPLAEAGEFTLIAVDLPGHGDSPLTREASFSRFSDEVLSLLDKLELEKVNLGGLSMGSGIGLNLTLKAPERVDSLILLRPSWLNAPKPSHLELVAKIGHWIKAEGVEQAETLLNLDPDYLALKERLPEVAASLPPLFRRPQAETAASVLYDMFEDYPFPSLKDLGEITQSVLLLDTTADELHPQQVAETLASTLPNTERYHTLPPRYLEKDAYNSSLREEVSRFLKA